MRTKSQSVQSSISRSSLMAERSMVRREAPPQIVEYLCFTSLRLGSFSESFTTSWWRNCLRLEIREKESY